MKAMKKALAGETMAASVPTSAFSLATPLAVTNTQNEERKTIFQLEAEHSNKIKELKQQLMDKDMKIQEL